MEGERKTKVKQTEESQQHQNGQERQEAASPEVVPGPRYRTFSREYKLRVLAEAEQCGRGEIGALLRREGLYYSTLTKWRQQQAAGRLEEPVARERKEDAQAQEIARLKREKAQLGKELARMKAVIEVQKKLCEIVGLDND